MEQRYDSRLRERKTSGLFRELPTNQVSGVDFTNNDYLGLSRHPAVRKAATIAVETHGLGGQASRLLGAQAQVARELESVIANAKSQDGHALVYATGFQLNASVISTLLNPDLLGAKPLVFTDRLIHSSVHAGIRIAGARQSRFNHNEMEHLERLLKKKAESETPIFVFVESLYGMDGDFAPMKELYRLKSKYNFFLYVDEAHTMGVAGEEGFGLAHQSPEQADVVIGTFSKALGAAGGFIVCSETIKQLLVNFSTGLIYSTAPSPAVLAGVLAAWQLLPGMKREREFLDELATALRRQLKIAGWQYGPSDSHIVPVMVGDADEAMKLQTKLAKQSMHVACIRPPTVPPGTSRLRISLNVNHTHEQIAQLVEVISK